MLDKQAAAVLQEIAAHEGYCVLDLRDLAAGLPARLHTDADALDGVLRALADGGYISIKYAQAGTYCLAALPKGKTAAAQQVRTRARLRMRVQAFALPFAGAFAGGAAAVLLCALLG